MSVCPECNQEHTPFCAPRSHDFSRSGRRGWMIGLALLLILLGSLGWMLNEEREAHQETMATMHAQSSMIAQINASHITATANAEQAVLQKTATVQAAATLEAEQTATVQPATTLEAEQTATAQPATTLEAEQTATAQPATTLEAEQMPTALQTVQERATAEAALQIANQTAPASRTPLAENSPSTATSAAVSTTLAAQTASGLTERVTEVANNATSITPSATPPPLATELPSIASSTPLTPSATPPALATELPSIATSTPLTSSESAISAINNQAESPLVARMTESAQNAPEGSPYYKTTWVTYYGRPNVGVMGILGAYNINELIPLLREQTLAYDEANGPELDVMPAFHLVYGMATILPGEDNDHLAFLSDEVVMAYIEAAQQENMAVILDIQIGALTPPDAIERGLPFLQYENVHLAIDPEFAMKEPNQSRPGNPIGFITAQEVNQVQQTMQEYINNHKIQGTRILLLHQFLDPMIVNKEQLQAYRHINLTITADGWGPPGGKIRKYNGFTNQNTFFTGFKLFYDWDHPLLTEREALGIDPAEEFTIEITPNLIIYQ